MARGRSVLIRASATVVALCPANYYCPGALKEVPPALRIISMPSSAVNSWVVLIALRCPRLAAANTAAPAAAASGASCGASCLIDEQAVIVAEARVPADQSGRPRPLSAHTHGGAPVLRVVDEGCPGLRSVGRLRHAERRRVASSFLRPTLSY